MDESAEPTDNALLLAWGRGDKEAGELLVERHFEIVYRFIAALIPGSVDIADMVQRTFLACVERVDDIAQVERFRPYLLGIARNQVRMQHRRQKVREGEQLVEDPQEHARASWNPRLSGVAAAREQQRLLLLALRRLPLDQQLPLELHYWDGLTMREIAKLLDVQIGTVKKRLFTARRRLAEWMGALARDEATAQLSLSQFNDWANAMRDLIADADELDDSQEPDA